MAFLLDTDLCIAVLRGVTQAIDWLTKVSPHECHASTVTRFELTAGVEKCRDPSREQAKVDALLGAISEVVFDRSAARAAGIVRAGLERAGRTIGPYDILLAGHAMALGLTLVTHNTREFKRVEGLTVADWR